MFQGEFLLPTLYKKNNYFQHFQPNICILDNIYLLEALLGETRSVKIMFGLEVGINLTCVPLGAKLIQ
jgi:hypothetical protein